MLFVQGIDDVRRGSINQANMCVTQISVSHMGPLYQSMASIFSIHHKLEKWKD